MSWILKNWYIVLVVAAIIIWLIIDPSITEKKEVANQIVEENNLELPDDKEKVPTEYKIDIKGEIKSPGVYPVTENDRVEDAIQLAGGFTKEANKQSINLAERVYDEMVIYVPAKGETPEKTNVVQGVQDEDPKVKVNIASAEEMQAIPGIGEVKANAIIEYRETNGPYEKLEDLTKVSGIGDKTVERMKEYIRIP
ncbi:helix-hairpin-helix domain-containing protein [Gracilibacillus sp. D59]|uniref:helix-hairpin-helix domain-containing protein n=1 Tax=Gracilibacillus sp. D59 TaxID=3457434 RepID=UPI003FCDEABE